MIRPIAYVAGPYTAQTIEQRDANIAAADSVGRELLTLGYAVIVPHTMSRDWEHDERLSHESFLSSDLALLRHCHLLVLTTVDWTKSRGTCQEVTCAREYGIPIFGAVTSVPSADCFELDTQSIHLDNCLERVRLGVERYGRRLYPYNGRESGQDAYEEAIDLGFYQCQALRERGS